eukprot:5857905-Pleurochrysis_carterae.AAC.5
MGGGSSKGDNEDKVDKLAATAPDEELVAAARDLPLPPGHQLLAEFASALEREYALREGPIVGDFLDGLDEDCALTDALKARHATTLSVGDRIIACLYSSQARLKRESIKVKNFITWTEWVEAYAAALSLAPVS